MEKIFLFLLLLLSSTYTTHFKIDKEKRRFVDSTGRVTIFHGVNAMLKQPPYIPITTHFDPLMSLSIEDTKYMKEFGFNFVRLGVIWESVERAPGIYDLEHLDKIEKLINMLGENGMYVLLDAHQDLFSRLFCGEGMPIFYAKELDVDDGCNENLLSKTLKAFGVCLPLNLWEWRYDGEGMPLLEDCKHFMNYHLSSDLTSAYDSFYKNQHGIQEKFIEFWKVMLNKFKDNPYIIGFDLWNEPWPGSLWSSLWSWIPGWSTNNQLLPFYKKVDEELRKVKDDYVFFFEPVPFPDTIPFFGGKVIGGFTETPAGKSKVDSQVLNLHSYCCQAMEGVCDEGEPYYDDRHMCRDFHKHKTKAHFENANELGVPLFITEFGACSDTQACYHEMHSFVESAEEDVVSWAYWMYKPYDDHTTTAMKHTEGIFYENGDVQDVKIRTMTRTYMQKYQGNPITSSFDESGYFYTSFYYDNTINAPSILYLHKNYFYKNGYKLRAFDNNHRNIDLKTFEEGNYIAIHLNGWEYVFGNKSTIVNIAIIPHFKSNHSKVTYKSSDRICIDMKTNSEFLMKVETKDTVYELNYTDRAVFSERFIKKLTIKNSEYKIELENILLYDIVIDL